MSSASTLPIGQEAIVTCLSSHGTQIRANCLSLGANSVAFEVCNPNAVLQLSEVLSDFRLTVNQRPVYSGRAVLRNMAHTGLVIICEATLEGQWLDMDGLALGGNLDDLPAGFEAFLRGWESLYRVDPEFKVVVADLQTLLTDLRLWLEQVEMGIRASPVGDRVDMEREALVRLEKQMIPVINTLHERFELVAGRIEDEMRPVHQTFARRLLHPLFLCCPFGFRAFQKPLGYAGDYELVNMIVRDPYEGGSLFAKAMNLWLLRQYPSQAHRHRLALLEEKLGEEALRAKTRGRRARILNVACGPAHEIQQFLRNSPLAENAELTLVDFNAETLEHTRGAIEQVQREVGRTFHVRLQQKSAMQLVKEASRSSSEEGGNKFDFVYCAGLFDYLADRTCKQLVSSFYNSLAADGCILVTNVVSHRPFKHMLEFLLDWYLICRDSNQLLGLVPDPVTRDNCSVKSESLGTNLFLEIRKAAAC